MNQHKTFGASSQEEAQQKNQQQMQVNAIESSSYDEIVQQPLGPTKANKRPRLTGMDKIPLNEYSDQIQQEGNFQGVSGQVKLGIPSFDKFSTYSKQSISLLDIEVSFQQDILRKRFDEQFNYQTIQENRTQIAKESSQLQQNNGNHMINDGFSDLNGYPFQTDQDNLSAAQSNMEMPDQSQNMNYNPSRDQADQRNPKGNMSQKYSIEEDLGASKENLNYQNQMGEQIGYQLNNIIDSNVEVDQVENQRNIDDPNDIMNEEDNQHINYDQSDLQQQLDDQQHFYDDKANPQSKGYYSNQEVSFGKQNHQGEDPQIMFDEIQEMRHSDQQNIDSSRLQYDIQSDKFTNTQGNNNNNLAIDQNNNSIHRTDTAYRLEHRSNYQHSQMLEEQLPQQIKNLKLKIMDASTLIKENKKFQLRILTLEEEIRSVKLQHENTLGQEKKYQSELSNKNNEILKFKQEITSLEGQLKSSHQKIKQNKNEQKAQNNQLIEELKQKIREQQDDIDKKTKRIIDLSKNIETLKKQGAKQPSSYQQLDDFDTTDQNLIDTRPDQEITEPTQFKESKKQQKKASDHKIDQIEKQSVDKRSEQNQQLPKHISNNNMEVEEIVLTEATSKLLQKASKHQDSSIIGNTSHHAKHTKDKELKSSEYNNSSAFTLEESEQILKKLKTNEDIAIESKQEIKNLNQQIENANKGLQSQTSSLEGLQQNQQKQLVQSESTQKMIQQNQVTLKTIESNIINQKNDFNSIQAVMETKLTDLHTKILQDQERLLQQMQSQYLLSIQKAIQDSLNSIQSNSYTNDKYQNQNNLLEFTSPLQQQEQLQEEIGVAEDNQQTVEDQQFENEINNFNDEQIEYNQNLEFENDNDKENLEVDTQNYQEETEQDVNKNINPNTLQNVSLEEEGIEMIFQDEDIYTDNQNVNPIQMQNQEELEQPQQYENDNEDQLNSQQNITQDNQEDPTNINTFGELQQNQENTVYQQELTSQQQEFVIQDSIEKVQITPEFNESEETIDQEKIPQINATEELEVKHKIQPEEIDFNKLQNNSQIIEKTLVNSQKIESKTQDIQSEKTQQQEEENAKNQKSKQDLKLNKHQLTKAGSSQLQNLISSSTQNIIRDQMVVTQNVQINDKLKKQGESKQQKKTLSIDQKPLNKNLNTEDKQQQKTKSQKQETIIKKNQNPIIEEKKVNLSEKQKQGGDVKRSNEKQQQPIRQKKQEPQQQNKSLNQQNNQQIDNQIEDDDGITIKRKPKKVALTIDDVLKKYNYQDQESLQESTNNQSTTQQVQFNLENQKFSQMKDSMKTPNEPIEEEFQIEDDNELDFKELSQLVQNKKKQLLQQEHSSQKQSQPQQQQIKSNPLQSLLQQQPTSQQNNSFKYKPQELSPQNKYYPTLISSPNPFLSQHQNYHQQSPPILPYSQSDRLQQLNQQPVQVHIRQNEFSLSINESIHQEEGETQFLDQSFTSMQQQSPSRNSEPCSPSNSSQKSARQSNQYTVPIVHTNQEQLNAQFIHQISTKGIKQFLQDELSHSDYSNNYYRIYNSHFEILKSITFEQFEKLRETLSDLVINDILLTLKYSQFKECLPANQVQHDYNIFSQYFLNRDNLPYMEKSYSYLFQKKNIQKKEQMLLCFDPFSSQNRQKFLIVFSLILMYYKQCRLEVKILELLEYSVKGGINYDFIYIFVNTYPQIYLSIEEHQLSSNFKKAYPISENEITKLISLKQYYSFNSKDVRYTVVENKNQVKGKPGQINNSKQNSQTVTPQMQQLHGSQYDEELGEILLNLNEPQNDYKANGLSEYACLAQTLRLIIIIVIYQEYTQCSTFIQKIKIHQILQLIESFLRINSNKSKVDEVILKQINQNDVTKRLQEEVLGYKKNYLFFQKNNQNSFEEDMVMNYMLRFYIIYGDMQLQKWMKNAKDTTIHFNYYDFIGSFNLVIEFIKQTNSKLAEKVYVNILKGYFTNPKYCYTILKTLQIVNIYKLIKIISNQTLILEIHHNFQKILEGSSNHSSAKSNEFQDIDSQIVQNFIS